jgi:hypothetical protein
MAAMPPRATRCCVLQVFLLCSNRLKFLSPQGQDGLQGEHETDAAHAAQLAACSFFFPGRVSALAFLLF